MKQKIKEVKGINLPSPFFKFLFIVLIISLFLLFLSSCENSEISSNPTDIEFLDADIEFDSSGEINELSNILSLLSVTYPQPRNFIDNGNETVTDSVTGLVWQKGFEVNLTWYEAQNYCQNLSLDGKDWRLPTPHELRTLIDYEIFNPSINTVAFPNTPPEWFWSTKHASFNDVASGMESSWIIYFYDGFVEYTSRLNLYNVRCITDID